MSKLSKILIIVFGIIFIVLVAAYFVAKKVQPVTAPQKSLPTPAVSEQNLSFKLTSTQSTVNVGDKIQVSVFLTGSGAENVSAFDIKIDYDKNKLELANATQGSFFAENLQIKWDLAKAWFSLARNPSSGASQPASPLLTLEFSALAKAGQTSVSVSPGSQVYVSQTGGVTPGSQTVSIIIR